MVILQFIQLVFLYRIFSQQVELSKKMNINLGLGIGAFQGLSNVALNGKYSLYLDYSIYKLKCKIYHGFLKH